jgi:hypothetical protein
VRCGGDLRGAPLGSVDDTDRHTNVVAICPFPISSEGFSVTLAGRRTSGQAYAAVRSIVASKFRSIAEPIAR